MSRSVRRTDGIRSANLDSFRGKMRTFSDAIRSKLPIFEIMRADRLCAELSRASHRGPRRLGVYVLGLALIARLCVPSDVSRAAGPTPEARPAYFAVLGEVASPGVYELPTGCTLAQLVRSAGGITRDADGNARVFRGARLAERLFVASSESAILYPGDLILIDRRATGQSANKLPRNCEVNWVSQLDRPARRDEDAGRPGITGADCRILTAASGVG